ncbi:biotin carboxyl carrier domain-containing protein [Thermobifida alba]|jgi:acetyl-CoA carboxylase biotin carboxyl carrier protein|uniref:Biotin carboxyl carrier protein of acetyl-CoA carboxylase n=1 Tax=Thermobifida alba TaxID=53522 RepID=A0ABY4KZK1_THEAE|nr:acetyl-CoA carboxylase [Thermobifida alba]UPT20485.1 biotin carboxyl carrier domain-containing protein [Thermobifida alba]HLU95923.1 acetyl-CoA carboxylase [Thermobifida alba]
MASTRVIASPVSGHFYRRPRPDQPPFVEEGQRVEAGQTIGVIETAKQFTEVKSVSSGTLAEFAVPDERMLSQGETIARIVEE